MQATNSSSAPVPANSASFRQYPSSFQLNPQAPNSLQSVAQAAAAPTISRSPYNGPHLASLSSAANPIFQGAQLTPTDQAAIQKLRTEMEHVTQYMAALVYNGEIHNHNDQAFQTNFDTLQTDIKTVQTDVNSLRTNLNILQADINTLGTDDRRLLGYQQTLKTKSDQVIKRHNDLVHIVMQQRSEIDALKAQVRALSEAQESTSKKQKTEQAADVMSSLSAAAAAAPAASSASGNSDAAAFARDSISQFSSSSSSSLSLEKTHDSAAAASTDMTQSKGTKRKLEQEDENSQAGAAAASSPQGKGGRYRYESAGKLAIQQELFSSIYPLKNPPNGLEVDYKLIEKTYEDKQSVFSKNPGFENVTVATLKRWYDDFQYSVEGTTFRAEIGMPSRNKATD